MVNTEDDMWTYIQVTGGMWDPDFDLLAVGYAGMGVGKNNPSLQSVFRVGPLPAGKYIIQAPADDAQVGEYAMRLIPDPANQMYLRADFFIHGDSREHPGEASDGCIVLDLPARQAIWASGDHLLLVISYEEDLWTEG